MTNPILPVRGQRFRALTALLLTLSLYPSTLPAQIVRERISIDNHWRFTLGDPSNCPVNLLYDPALRPAKAKTNSASTNPPFDGIKSWILPAANNFITDSTNRHERPAGNLGEGVPYIDAHFDDSSWATVNLPHDWAIAGPFITTGGGGMGRLPTAGVGWYRKELNIPASDAGQQIYLDVDGAMAYAAVWLNGQFVGGWPYGYASWRLDLTPYVKPGAPNELAIRLDNPPNSSRWYPGAGLYRHVWLVKTTPVHVAHWGTFLTTTNLTREAGTVNLKLTVENDSSQSADLTATTTIYPLDSQGLKTGRAVATLLPSTLTVPAQSSASAESTGSVPHPLLWGPPPQQKPNRYVAETILTQGGKVVDVYETPFGFRTIQFDPNAGFLINGQHILINGVCDHHDLGALGAAFNQRALERQFQELRDMGCNAIRTSHNPPAPELLDLADKMGFLVMDEAFDCWMRQKTAYDYHLLFRDWHEPDLRAQIRRDRNHPSIIMWSIGNEVGEQSGPAGGEIARALCDIVHQEDPTRPTTSAMNSAGPNSAIPATVELIGLNYQGAGVRNSPSQYPAFHKKFPDKFLYASESASTVSSRGDFMFPVTTNISIPAAEFPGGEDRKTHEVSAYELYAASWASSPDRTFAAQDRNPYSGGEFVWTGWDYLGEPTPFDTRSSYFGIIDLAGFKKDRYYIYQAHWRPDFPMAHILPHWTWPERTNQITPVHVFTSGDEAELFLNGKSLGRKKKGQYEYRLRWDDVVYQPGTLKVVAYKNGKKWATDVMKTAGPASRLKLAPDRDQIRADGRDLSFVTLTVTDRHGLTAPRAMDQIHFDISGPGEIVATDNGDPANLVPFPSPDRKAFEGLCLVIVRGKPGEPGKIKITATAPGLRPAATIIKTLLR